MNEDRQSHDALIGAALLVALVLTAITLGVISGLQWYLSPDNELSIVQRRDLVQGLASAGQALAVFLTGAVGLIGLYFTWQNTSQARKSNQETLDLTRRGQITERFTQAIDQLGKDNDKEERNLEVRLGGIYSLERTAREDRDYHWPIMEVLTTYIRQYAIRKPEVMDEECVQTPAPDIQAILTVIGRRSKFHRIDEQVEYGSIDLHDTDLRKANLRDAYLSKANFAGADLRDASLAGANLQSAVLENADLRGAYLGAVDLRNVYFINTNLAETVLIQADLRAADISRAIGVAQHQLDNALGDSHTILPHHLRPPSLWSLEIDEQRTRLKQTLDETIDSTGTTQASNEQSDRLE